MSTTINSLSLFSGQSFPCPSETINPAPKDQKNWDDMISPHQRIERSVSQYVHHVTKKNHGIREANIISMLLPIGMDVRMVDFGLVSSLDAFGVRRGEAAHLSAAGAIQQGVDPSSELAVVERLLEDLLDIDKRLDTLLAEVAGSPGL